MANVTPFATPKGGFPLVLTVVKTNGAKVTTSFPNTSAINPADPEVEAAYKAMYCVSAADTLVPAAT
jgi:hypothetical protein